MENLIESVGKFLTPNILGQLGTSLGESPATMAKAAPMGIAALVAGLGRSVNQEGGADRLLQTSRSMEPLVESYGSDVTDQSKRQTLFERGHGLVSGLFGGGLSGITSSLSAGSGASPRATTGLLAMLAPLVLGVIGKHARERRLDGAGLSSFLGGQTNLVSRYLPSGLGSMFSVESPGARRIAVSGAREVEAIAPRRASRMGWLVPLLAVGALLVGGYALLKNRSTEVSVNTPSMQAPEVEKPGVPTYTPPEGPTMPAAPPMGPSTEAKQEQTSPEGATPAPMEGPMTGSSGMEGPSALGGGPPAAGEAGAASGGIESALAGGAGKSFELDKVNFDNASSQPRAESSAALDTLAESLKRHPDARIRLVGHTDSRGSDEINHQLANARASAVKQALVQRGVDAGRIEIAEKSSTSPTASNDTDEGRLANRRVSAEVIGP